MGNEASKRCCLGRHFQVRTSLPKPEERCHFWIPDAGSLIGLPAFTVYDASAAERTAWLTLAPASASLEAKEGNVALYRVLQERSGEPLLAVTLSTWTVRKLVEREQQERLTDWSAEGYGYQYVWEATRVLTASSRPQRETAAPPPRGEEGQGSSSHEEGASGVHEATLRVAYFGVAGSTNTPEALADIFSGDADLEVAARVKDWSATLDWKGAPVSLALDGTPGSGQCSFRATRPDLDLSFESGNVRIKVTADDRGTDALLLAALGFSAAHWAGPWSAEGAVAERAGEEVLHELRRGIAEAISSS